MKRIIGVWPIRLRGFESVIVSRTIDEVLLGIGDWAGIMTFKQIQRLIKNGELLSLRSELDRGLSPNLSSVASTP